MMFQMNVRSMEDPALTVALVKTRSELSPVDAHPILLVPFVKSASPDGPVPSVRKTSMNARTILAQEAHGAPTLKVAILVHCLCRR